MTSFKNLTKLQIAVFALIVCVCGILGYLFYDTYRTNIQDRELIKQTKEDNLDLSQDIAIIRDKYERLQKEVTELKNKVAKVTLKKKNYKKSRLQSAGKSSKYKKYYKRYKVNYRKLYFQLKKQCDRNKKKRTINYSYKYR